MRRAAVDSCRISVSAFVVFCSLLAAGCGHKTVTVSPPRQPPAATIPAQKPAPVPPPVVTPPTSATVTGAGIERTPVSPSTLPSPGPRGPSVRIGLTVPAEELRISAAGEFILVEKTPEALRQTLTGQVQVRLERPLPEAAEIYRVQVASLANQAAAEKLGRQLSEQFSMPTVVHENAATGTNQVRLGRFATRNEAQQFAAGPLAEAGYRDAFVVREVGEAGKGEPTLALRGPESLFKLSRAGYLFLPVSDLNFLRLNGKPYRGVLDISLSKDGRVIVVNQLGMEEYLLGVVPAELSPDIYPQEAALAAQAIAARTYALKSIGRYRADGYDLTDDTHTQVYGGVSIEKEASNAAVQKTFGIAIYYDGSLIDAMYMSTCGGRTEDYADVFDAAPKPYLKSVFCTVESGAADMPEANIGGSHELSQVLFADDGTPANRELELAQVLGLTSFDRITPEVCAGMPGPDEIRGWLEKSRLLAGKTDKESTAQETGITSRAGFLRYAAEHFFGMREIDRSVSESDTAYYLSNFSDGAAVPADARHALAYLVQRKLWQPYPDNSVRPNQPVQRGDALALLIRWITSVRPEILKTGVSAEPSAEIAGGGSRSTLIIKRGSRTERLPLARDVRLFKATAGRSMPVGGLRVIGNEKLAYHQNPNGEIDFLEVELSASGASSDRFSPVATWQTTITRAVVAEKLRSLAGNVGEVRDLKPARFGASGRVVQLEIIGSRGSVVVNGYKARGALGLRDTLYTLSRARTDDGSVASFTFDGRGWGHGVGLCQTGAVGMARAGRSAEEILKTYYQGVELRKVY
ncbi:MAG: SpoIID/LytB domain-containing protein [Acidobacteriia bacterium]|nr:SpoIID/LytB domain-containing protein [Terriglobia bacterium]